MVIFWIKRHIKIIIIVAVVLILAAGCVFVLLKNINEAGGVYQNKLGSTNSMFCSLLGGTRRNYYYDVGDFGPHDSGYAQGCFITNPLACQVLGGKIRSLTNYSGGDWYYKFDSKQSICISKVSQGEP